MFVRALTLSWVAVLFSSLAQADFRSVLAERLATSPEHLILNVPPRPEAWPGAIFTDDLRIPIIRGKRDDPALARGQPTSIEASDIVDFGAAGRVGWSSWFSIAAKAGDVGNVVMSFPDIRIVDLPYEELLKRVKDSKIVQESLKRGRVPVIVAKAYEGTPTLTVSRRTGISAEAFADLKKAAAEAKLQASALAEDRVVYTTTAPIVFAFEVLQANFDRAEAEQQIKLTALPAYSFYTAVLVQQEEELLTAQQSIDFAAQFLGQRSTFAAGPSQPFGRAVAGPVWMWSAPPLSWADFGNKEAAR